MTIAQALELARASESPPELIAFLRDLQTQAGSARHDVGNALAIVQANLEGMIDGLLPVTPESLSALHAALLTAKNGISRAFP